MVKLWIDDVAVEAPETASVLDAARSIGLDIPALCKHDDYPPNTSCMCCLVLVDGAAAPVPACATPVREGMHVESESPGVRDLRRTGLELLLGDHAGDCRAPCENTCPARMDIPNMLRHVASGDYRAAIAVVKQEIALPAILGRVCPEVCEHACRRGLHDSPAAICRIKRFVADRDYDSPHPYQPPTADSTGRRVAIVGGGPTGLTAAFHLTLAGYHCRLIEEQSHLGGRLRREFSATELPPRVLEQEVAAVLALGVECETDRRIDGAHDLNDLLHGADAVLLATGRPLSGWLQSLGVEAAASGVKVDSASRRTCRERVFAAGNVVRTYKLVVQSVAEGKLAAECIDAVLSGRPTPDRRRAFESRLDRLAGAALCEYCEGSPPLPRVDVRLLEGATSDDVVRREAERCLHCDCEALGHCLLHRYAEAYHCDARRFAGPGQTFRGRIVGERVTLEIGKCIACGICQQIAAATPGAAGLATLNRSDAIRIAPPPGVTLDDALGSAAKQCADACPTGAIVLRPG
jgi:NADPH-dependent 2,4-dienoyl-CoA reductase/sulfur reductase-like enzyme/ferredoxin